MKRPEELSHMLTEMYNDTKDGKIHWNISVQTTENNEVSEKPVEVEDGVSWTIDECYVSYYCKYKGQDFLMITYEMIKTAGDKVHTTNMIFRFHRLESVCSSCQCCCRMRFRRPVCWQIRSTICGNYCLR